MPHNRTDEQGVAREAATFANWGGTHPAEALKDRFTVMGAAFSEIDLQAWVEIHRSKAGRTAPR